MVQGEVQAQGSPCSDILEGDTKLYPAAQQSLMYHTYTKYACKQENGNLLTWIIENTFDDDDSICQQSIGCNSVLYMAGLRSASLGLFSALRVD